MSLAGTRQLALGLGVAAAVVSALARPSATMQARPAEVDRYEGGEWAHRVRPWRRPEVVAVAVAQAGAGDGERNAASEPEACASFRPSSRELRRFFARAKLVSQRHFVHETDWSACHAAGGATFRGGARARWWIHRLGAGYLEVAGARHYLHCRDCMLGDRSTQGARP